MYSLVSSAWATPPEATMPMQKQSTKNLKTKSRSADNEDKDWIESPKSDLLVGYMHALTPGLVAVEMTFSKVTIGLDGSDRTDIPQFRQQP